MKRSGRIARKTRLRSRNPQRRKREFARCYGSKARVAWVKTWPCAWCFKGPSENAHTEGDGMGRKAGYETIAPLCRECHQRYDEHRYPFNQEHWRADMRDAANQVRIMWDLLQERTA